MGFRSFCVSQLVAFEVADKVVREHLRRQGLKECISVRVNWGEKVFVDHSPPQDVDVNIADFERLYSEAGIVSLADETHTECWSVDAIRRVIFDLGASVRLIITVCQIREKEWFGIKRRDSFFGEAKLSMNQTHLVDLVWKIENSEINTVQVIEHTTQLD